MPKCYIVTGSNNEQKSSDALEAAKKTDSFLISSTTMKEILGEEKYSKMSKKEVFNEAVNMARTAIKNGKDIVVDDIYTSKGGRELWLERLSEKAFRDKAYVPEMIAVSTRFGTPEQEPTTKEGFSRVEYIDTQSNGISWLDVEGTVGKVEQAVLEVDLNSNCLSYEIGLKN